MLKKTIAIAALTLASSAAVNAEELFKAEDAVKYRQSIYQIFAAQTGVIGGMLQGEMPFDGAEINKRAKNIAMVAPLLGETYFPATSEVKESNLKANAWKNMEDFQSKGKNFGKALGALVTASADPSFDIKTARKTAGALFQGCKACHEDYRAK